VTAFWRSDGLARHGLPPVLDPVMLACRKQPF
jgi:hypothetical protein